MEFTIAPGFSDLTFEDNARVTDFHKRLMDHVRGNSEPKDVYEFYAEFACVMDLVTTAVFRHGKNLAGKGVTRCRYDSEYTKTLVFFCNMHLAFEEFKANKTIVPF